jgi:hypothetical protein
MGNPLQEYRGDGRPAAGVRGEQNYPLLFLAPFFGILLNSDTFETCAVLTVSEMKDPLTSVIAILSGSKKLTFTNKLRFFHPTFTDFRAQ